MATDQDTIERLREENAGLREELERLREQIARKEERTRLILQAALEGFHVVAMNGDILDCNPSFARIVGYERSELLSMNIAQIDRQEPGEIAALLEELRAKGAMRFVTRHVHKDGRPIDVEVSAHLVSIDGEEVFSAFSHPITEQIRREQALRESEQKFRAIFDETSMFIGLLTPAGELIECNRTLAEFTGARSGEGRGEPLWQAPFWGGDARAEERVKACVQKATSGVPAACEAVLHGPGGRAATLELKMKPILEASGETVLVIAEGYDVTELRRAEAERASLQEQMIHAQEATIRELSTPLIPLDAGILVTPLVGRLDKVRIGQLLERLLHGVVAQRATTVILDVTGVPMVDAEIADALLRAAQAVKLLGAEVILTGVGPEVAQTMVSIGIDLREITTLSSLQSGLHHALSRSRGRRRSGGRRVGGNGSGAPGA
ncbi:PAS domain S-box protein [Sorangium sp. So ce1036]|uniref:PAS domain S-box protein n=1 Tax=Sorangium sp. So ce1036 TaxID=3133328 RepID=UPI003F10085A